MVHGSGGIDWLLGLLLLLRSRVVSHGWLLQSLLHKQRLLLRLLNLSRLLHLVRIEHR